MGTEATTNDTYLGEVPKHNVSLSPFYASKITITKEIYKQYDPTYDNEFEQDMPAINVTWYDAAMFCLWLGCRLLTEAEWEYICRAGSPGNWCCRNEDELKQYAWYSENSHGMLHATAQLEPNQFGFYDLHGNVWEWCTDNYDEQYYAISPTDNPINTNENRNKVCRGGSYQAFSEMCRSALRYHEPAHFYSQDTGFRIAKSIPTHE
jgi:formylglycine-generating enzyme required for sulfatase activity